MQTNKQVKILFYDLETTGTDKSIHAIHQLNFKLIIDGELIDELDIKIAPFKGAIIDDIALKVGNVTLEQIMAYMPQEEGYKKLMDFLGKYVDKFDKQDKIFLGSYNGSSFDNPFFREFFRRNNNKYFGAYFWSGEIDVMVLALDNLMDKRIGMENFKLMTVAKAYGIEVEEAKLHDAGYDVYLTVVIYFQGIKGVLPEHLEGLK